MRRFDKAHWLAIGLLAGASLNSSAWAQSSPPAAAATANDASLSEIVVTAQKRSENLQAVPISVNAFTAEAIQAKHITSVQALGNLAPSVNLDAGSPFSGSNSVLSAYIRGIGQDDFAFNSDPGVGVYLDGVYLARTTGANTDLLDVERIEILKGPQGTLFGRNTIGGAISIVTRAPSDQFHVAGQVTGGSFNRLDALGVIDMPLTNGWTSSLSFSSKNREGYQKRPALLRATMSSTVLSSRRGRAQPIARMARPAKACAPSCGITRAAPFG